MMAKMRSGALVVGLLCVCVCAQVPVDWDSRLQYPDCYKNNKYKDLPVSNCQLSWVAAAVSTFSDRLCVKKLYKTVSNDTEGLNATVGLDSGVNGTGVNGTSLNGTIEELDDGLDEYGYPKNTSRKFSPLSLQFLLS